MQLFKETLHTVFDSYQTNTTLDQHNTCCTGLITTDHSNIINTMRLFYSRIYLQDKFNSSKTHKGNY